MGNVNVNVVIENDLDNDVFYTKRKTQGTNEKVFSIKPLPSSFVLFDHKKETEKEYEPVFDKKEFIDNDTKEVRTTSYLKEFLKTQQETITTSYRVISSSYHVTEYSAPDANPYNYGIHTGEVKLAVEYDVSSENDITYLKEAWETDLVAYKDSYVPTLIKESVLGVYASVANSNDDAEQYGTRPTYNARYTTDGIDTEYNAILGYNDVSVAFTQPEEGKLVATFTITGAMLATSANISYGMHHVDKITEASGTYPTPNNRVDSSTRILLLPTSSVTKKSEEDNATFGVKNRTELHLSHDDVNDIRFNNAKYEVTFAEGV